MRTRTCFVNEAKGNLEMAYLCTNYDKCGSTSNLILFVKWLVDSRSVNLLTPGSDKHTTSPYNIHTLSSKQVMRILKLIS